MYHTFIISDLVYNRLKRMRFAILFIIISLVKLSVADKLEELMQRLEALEEGKKPQSQPGTFSSHSHVDSSVTNGAGTQLVAPTPGGK